MERVNTHRTKEVSPVSGVRIRKLWPQGSHLTVCDSCALTTDGAVLRTLEQIAALPEVLGRHACECGHPEMRYLPDGVFHCPACGSEVLPSEAPLASSKRDLGPAWA
jgi:hypothetical protein